MTHRTTLRRSIRELPPAAWLLFAGTFISKFGAFVIVFLAVYVTRQGFSTAQAGIALSAYGIGALFSSPVGGYLADHLGRRKAIAASMYGSAAAMLGLSQAHGLPAIVVLAAAAGFTSELYRPAAGALLADLTPTGQRVPAFAMNRLAVNAGFAAGPAVGGFLAERSFFLLFLGDAVTSTIFGTIALAALPAGNAAAEAGAGAGKGWVRAVLTDRPFRVFLAANAVGILVLVQAFSSFAVHVSERVSSAAYGTLISLNGLLVVLLELPVASVTQRLPPRRVMAVGFLLLGTGFALTAAASSWPTFAVVVFVFTLGEITYMPVAGAYVADIAPPEMRGRYHGAWGLTFGIAFVIGPTLGTMLYAANATVLWLGCLAVGALAAALVRAGPEAGGRHDLRIDELADRDHQVSGG
ncbi:MAG: MFS transporter [Gemmatimonadetes bacterium]|uniref:MFS transporter n=1 Tax=Candidatus Kutchimonas denitrificans TaxID=3056748 RepID=A0AAE4ZA65_9BACT|nr:MFS transporter [Gemmatimonadota bacterium]NIR76433.1 MFS transporter [Candidatus Kutchimonas denitrificans]NIS03252.1 MFS transporter [Gemmatimonadota bacterium]NIT69113.1 MFS transporter [Gemmatimonadota bacterium]NIU54505.1 MFS transporter [Gemmatimonadota bacterium]